MSKVVMHNVVSVDGFIADDNDDVGPLLDWYFNGDTPIAPRAAGFGGIKVSRPRPTTSGRCGTASARS